MSYVIQNFHKPLISTASNHRFQLIINHNNILTLFMFFKFYLLQNNTPLTLKFLPTLWKLFFTGFFYKRLIFFESLFSIHSRLHLTTKFHRTVHFNLLKCYLDLLKGQSPCMPIKVPSGDSVLTSTYFFSVKVIFTQLKNKIYKPLFIFFMLLSSLHWPSLSERYFFINTFFFVARPFKLIYFENIKIFRTQYL